MDLPRLAGTALDGSGGRAGAAVRRMARLLGRSLRATQHIGTRLARGRAQRGIR